MVVGIEIKERRKWDKDNLFHTQRYEASDLILVNVKSIK